MESENNDLKRIFSGKDLAKLIFPLVIELMLTLLVGMIDSVMVSSAGEAAVSGVSLVDTVFQLLIYIFSAFGTGGAVVAGQYLGAGQKNNAKETAQQLVWFSAFSSIVIMVLIYLIRGFLLGHVYGAITQEVHWNANRYLMIVGLSIPALSVYESGAAIFRTMGNSKITWKALEEAYNEGKLKAIGVSNFQIEDLESLMEIAKVKPMVNQVLCHISNTPLELVEFCQKSNILVEAYSPIAHGEILNQPEVKAIADKYGVTVPQLCIRYTLQLGALPLPKTANPEHMRDNAKVDFMISDSDMEKLKAVERIKNYGEFSGFPVYGGKM